MANIQWLPGAGLLRQAWDATKLVGTIIDKRREKALVVAQENHAKLMPYRGKKATKKVKEVIESKDPVEIARLFMPDKAVNLAVDANKVYWKLWDLYWLLAFIRIFLTFSSVGSFLYNDESQGTVEALAGDIFQLDVGRSVDMNSTSPSKSMAIPMVLYGLPMLVLRGLDAIVFHWIGLSIVSSHMILLLPRVTMLILSFTMDYCIYQICLLYKHNFNRCLTTMASSYIMLALVTRSLEDSIELVLVTYLIYLTALSMKQTSETVYLHAMVQQKYDKAESIKERIELKKKKKLIPDHDFKCFFTISVVCVAGLFNRPLTFIPFSLVPLYFWFQRGIATDSMFTPFVVFHFRMASLIPGILMTFCGFVLCDSLYYGDLTWSKLWELTFSSSDWKCTPMQVVADVLVALEKNHISLATGDPIYYNALFNLPLLLGPLGFCTLISVINFFSEMITNEWKKKPGVRTVYALTLFSFVVPLAILSLLSPSTQLRHLLPLLAPSILLNAHTLREKVNGRRPLLQLWYVFNVLATVLLTVHQHNEVYSVVHHISNELKVREGTQDVHVIFMDTLSPTRIPLMQHRKGHEALQFHDQTRAYTINFDSLREKSLKKMSDYMIRVASRSQSMSHVKRKETFAVIPYDQLDELRSMNEDILLTLEVVYRSSPNLMMNLQRLVSFEELWLGLTSFNSEALAMFVQDLGRAINDPTFCLIQFGFDEDVKSVDIVGKRISAPK